MATYPNNLLVKADVIDEVDDAIAADYNLLKDEIIAMQSAVGTNPERDAADLGTRLNVSLNGSGALYQSNADPASGVIGQPLYRTDTDQFKIYDGSSWDVIGPSGFSVKSATSVAGTNTGDISIEANKLYVVIWQFVFSNSSGNINLRFNSDAGASNYAFAHRYLDFDSTAPATADVADEAHTGITLIPDASATSPFFGRMNIDTTQKRGDSAFVNGQSTFIRDASSFYCMTEFSGVYLASTTVVDFEFVSAATMTGSIFVYELALST